LGQHVGIIVGCGEDGRTQPQRARRNSQKTRMGEPSKIVRPRCGVSQPLSPGCRSHTAAQLKNQKNIRVCVLVMTLRVVRAPAHTTRRYFSRMSSAVHHAARSCFPRGSRRGKSKKIKQPTKRTTAQWAAISSPRMDEESYRIKNCLVCSTGVSEASKCAGAVGSAWSALSSGLPGSDAGLGDAVGVLLVNLPHSVRSGMGQKGFA